MKIALAQVSPGIGDLKSNLLLIQEKIQQAITQGASMIVFPEMCLTGYPALDSLTQPSFVQKSFELLDQLILDSLNHDLCVVLGAPSPSSGIKGIFNSAICFSNGKILAKHDKFLLPNYDVFDDHRYFDSGESITTFSFNNYQFGILICEDSWNHPTEPTIYNTPYSPPSFSEPLDAIFVLQASPFQVPSQRTDQLSSVAKTAKCPVFSVNQVGSYDHIIFDGQSTVISSSGDIHHQLESFKEVQDVVDFPLDPSPSFSTTDDTQRLHQALIRGIQDYVKRSGFTHVLIGLSGGIDSALTCALASQALGPEKVHTISMPSRFSSSETIKAAKDCADLCRVSHEVIPIDNLYKEFAKQLNYDEDALNTPSLAFENVQARIRGTILMTRSNELNSLVLTTGNKSELAIGFCTQYGDMCGALAVIGDLYKSQVYSLSEYINQTNTMIPEFIINVPPSAELKFDQKDSDRLPDYAILDPILKFILEEKKSRQWIINKGFDKDTVDWVLTMIQRNEYKRFQAPPVLKTSAKAFGPGRRYLVTSSQFSD